MWLFLAVVACCSSPGSPRAGEAEEFLQVLQVLPEQMANRGGERRRKETCAGECSGSAGDRGLCETVPLRIGQFLDV